MAKTCEICGKGPMRGRKIVRRGMAKAKGGAGRKITGKKLRRFLPNLQNVRTIIKGKIRTIRVCTRCIKRGKVKKV